MDEVCRHLAGLTQAVKSLQEGYSRLEEQVQALSCPSNPQGASSVGLSSAPSVVMLPPEPRVPTPERFAGERSKYRAFRNACELHFALQPRTFSLEATKVCFVISLLSGEPQTWAHHLLEQKSVSLDSLEAFFLAMSQLYEDPQLNATAEAALH
ncbi:protein LDOC1-like [Aquarana catesbeiana]|uniref:protein LDOC1-like n=1 Tax=Aquarana catesbeiana TaxID=8400 RepID=UPI003CC94030